MGVARGEQEQEQESPIKFPNLLPCPILVLYLTHPHRLVLIIYPLRNPRRHLKHCLINVLAQVKFAR